MYNSEAFSCPSDYDSDQDSNSDLEWVSYNIPVEPILFDFIAEDNKDAFVQRIKYGRSRSEFFADWYESPMLLSGIFDRIARFNAVKCATALLAGKAGFHVDINALDPDSGSSPMFFTFYPELVNLYISKGARTDIRCEGMLPFNKALDHLRIVFKERVDWSSKQSICMVIVFLCLNYLDLLESIRLLFDNTKEVVKEVYDYVKGGKLLETTALLLVAREEITSPSYFEDFTSSGSMSLHQLVLLEIESLKASETKLDSTDEEIHEPGNKLETMNSMLRMIKVLESVGPEIDQYRQNHQYRQTLPNVLLLANHLRLSMEELATKVGYFLISRGFVEYEDLKRSVSSETPYDPHTMKSYQHFLKLLESKLHGDIEGSHLESKDVAGTMELADMLEGNNRPPEAVETNYELQIKQLKMELEKERDELGNAQMRLQEEQRLNEYFQEELKSLKLEKEKTFTELNKLRSESNGEIVDISGLQTELNGLEDDSADDTVNNMTRLNTMSMDSDYLVDRRIVTKLLVTYFRTNRSKEVLDLMVRMLGFSDEDKQSIGIF
ncbi:hypothetical protein V6N13_045420 [Hibiscus sabdariffa]|uniref:Uncharacterized protein n=1 Tax=Hibiscus sabdariffa TaxID=183260 RepID=A0ABR2RLF8_9ROSI